MTKKNAENISVERLDARLPQSWLFWAALGAGISYLIPVFTEASGPLITVWKGLGVGLLACWAARNAWSFDGRLIAAVLALGAMGDVVLDTDLVAGGVLFALGHMVAIYLYLRNRRPRLSMSQAILAVLVIPAASYTAWMLPYDRDDAWQAWLYTFFVAAMAGAAWASRFPRYRTGIGAMMFVVSDLFIFSRFGPLEASMLPTMMVWPLYFGGQALIAWGVVDTLTGEADRREAY